MNLLKAKNMTKERYRLLIWLVLACGYLIGFFQRYALGVVAGNLRAELDLSGAQLGNLASVYFYTYAFMQIPVGMLVDSWGPKKVSTYGMLMAGIGSVLMGVTELLPLLYLGRFFIGLGVSGILISIFKIQAVWYPPERFATMTGYAAFIGNSGGLLATTPFAYLALTLGWQNSFLAIGIVSLFMVWLTWGIVRDKPQDAGFAGSKAVAEAEKDDIRIWEGFKKVLKNRNTWLCFIILFGLHGVLMSFTGVWGVSYLEASYGMTKDQAANYVLVFQLGVIIGSPVMGRVSDFLGKRKELIQGAAFLFLLFWIYKLVWHGGTPPLFMLGIFYFLAGFLVIFAMLCLSISKETNHPKFTALAIGVINMAPFLGTTFMNFFIGIVLDLTAQTGYNGYYIGFYVYPVFTLFALVSSLFLHEKPFQFLK